MEVIHKIDEAIKRIWKQQILNDYNKDFLLKEDSLKNSYYYHLRLFLGDGYLNRNRIRIFTEFHLGDNKRADIAVVRLKPKKEIRTEYYLKDRVEEVLAIIELKYKNNTCNLDPFIKDIEKTRKYLDHDEFERCQFYLGFIHEIEYPSSESLRLPKNLKTSWAQNRLTELSAFRDSKSGEFVSTIFSYNEFNPGLNSEV